jgi:hypothetical protein
VKRTSALAMGVILAFCALVAFAGASSAFPEATFIGFGDLPGSLFASTSHAVSADGPVVVGHSRSDSGFPCRHQTFSCEETLTCLLGALSSYADSAEEEKRTKRSSSRQNTGTLACDKARKSAVNRAKLDCLTSGGVIDSPKFSGCKCNPMGAKALCSVTVTYECS